MEAVEADIVASIGGGELTVDRVRAEVRALGEGIAAKQVGFVWDVMDACKHTFPCSCGVCDISWEHAVGRSINQ